MTALLGYGAHGHDIEAIWRRTHGFVGLDIYDDNGHRPPESSIDGFLFGSNFPAARRAMAGRYHPADPLIDPSVKVGTGCEVGDGSIVAPNCLMLRDVRLGQHVHVNYGVTMTRCDIGDFTTVAPGVTICGDVVIEEDVFIGAGAVICNLLRICKGAVIGAGAVVTRRVGPGQTVMGVPAK